MSDVTQFVGTWTSERGGPSSSQTMTWRLDNGRLRGRWLIEAGESPATSAAVAPGRPRRIELSVGDPSVEDGRLLFQILFPGRRTEALTEFRLLGRDEAVVGAAMDKMPPQLANLDPTRAQALRRAMEGQRVRLIRQDGPPR